MLMAITSLTLLVWSTRKPEGGSWWQAVLIAFLLFASVSLHFYAVVTIAIFGLMELLSSLRNADQAADMGWLSGRRWREPRLASAHVSSLRL